MSRFQAQMSARGCRDPILPPRSFGASADLALRVLYTICGFMSGRALPATSTADTNMIPSEE